MKIEKVNDHQIRCTLTKADLADRQLKLSELAYGTEKAKDLFRDMMQQAAIKFGFEAEDIPLMIEAIPLSGDCIVLIITKVEDPEELDTRFSKFAPSLHEHEDLLDDILSDLPDSADEMLDLFRKVQNSQMNKQSQADECNLTEEETESSEEPSVIKNITKMFSFSALQPLCSVSSQLNIFYNGENTLYKNQQTGKYFLVISQSDHKPGDFNRVCNILSEHGQMERYTPTHEAYIQEHFTTLIPKQAIQSLAIMEKASKEQ